jgi:hypothetical protein
MHSEGIRYADDLVGLDKADLGMLGFNMVERGTLRCWINANATIMETKLATLRLAPTVQSWSDAHDIEHGPGPSPQEDLVRRLDEVEQQADFWIDVVSSASATSKLRGASRTDLRDVRENMLEILFDLTEERVQEVYNGIDRDADGHITAAELGRGLQCYNIPELSEQALERLLDVVTAKKCKFLQLPEFEAVLSRLKLAQILSCSDIAQRLGPSVRLTVADYSTASSFATVHEVQRPREFFFGHRPQPSGSGSTLVRWVHSGGLDLTMLLALTVKYSLHPLSVEDVLEQSPTKIDRNGRNYFLAVEHLSLLGVADGSEPVRVRGRHVSVFCAGPPRSDTMITVTQPDKSFEEEWPGGAAHLRSEGDDLWPDRLRERLKAPLSRLREKLVDFLLYQVIDLCTDELVAVMRAYTKRLGFLELQLSSECSSLSGQWSSEVSLARLQLAVLVRRVRGLQRAIRHIIHDSDFSTGLSSYFQDVADHLEEAHGDAAYLAERCITLANMHERIIERGQERIRQGSADRLNRTLLTLTTLTMIFTPMQFVAGIYGMNFVDESGAPAIPELRHKYGYLYFWIAIGIYLMLSTCFAWCFFPRTQNNVSLKGACCYVGCRAPHDQHEPVATEERHAAAGQVDKHLCRFPSCKCTCPLMCWRT